MAFRYFRPGTIIGQPETVIIRFRGRDFVWHAIPPDDDGERYAPGLTVVAADEHEYNDILPEEFQRFLSAVAFHFDLAADVALFGGSGTSDPLAPPVPRE